MDSTAKNLVMEIDFQKLRLDGIYRQDEDNHLMLRLKLPSGRINSEQAVTLCDIAQRFTDGKLHLTCRGNLELHWLPLADLETARELLREAGLTSRGACGGAVRGISCNIAGHDRFPALSALARRLQQHFTGNPQFEGLPKKFKIGIEPDTASGRHLIQDAGLVLRQDKGDGPSYDLWVGGGLGREPRQGFLLAIDLAEDQILALLERVIAVYRTHGEAGRRLKHLIIKQGADWLRRETGQPAVEVALAGQHRQIDNEKRLDINVFAGEIDARQLRAVAEVASRFAGGEMVITAEQNIALPLAMQEDHRRIREQLQGVGLGGDTRQERVQFRVCPGNHECRMGLAATRDVARQVIEALGENGRSCTWAISGCPNSCSQPQLADFGIVTRKVSRQENGSPLPVFEIWRRSGEGIGECLAKDLQLADLITAVRNLR